MASKKTVIVTGASQGIGAAVVQAFLDRGYNVFLSGMLPVVDRKPKGRRRGLGPVSRCLWHRKNIGSGGNWRCQPTPRGADRTRCNLRSRRVANFFVRLLDVYRHPS